MTGKKITRCSYGHTGRRLRLRKPLIQARGFSMQKGEKLLTAAIYLARLRDSGQRDHAYRIRVANKLRNLVDAFIAEEVREATSQNKNDPSYMSWTKVAECLNLSRSATYARYSKND